MEVSMLHEVMTKKHNMTMLHSSSACTYFNLDTVEQEWTELLISNWLFSDNSHGLF